MKFSIIIFVLATLWPTFVATQVITMTYPSEEPAYTPSNEPVYYSSEVYPTYYPSSSPPGSSSNPYSTSFGTLAEEVLEEYLFPYLTPSCQNTVNKLFYNATINQCLQELYTSVVDRTGIIYLLTLINLDGQFGAMYSILQTFLNEAPGSLDQFCSPATQCSSSLTLDAISQLKSGCSDTSNQQMLSWFYDAVILAQPAVETLCMKSPSNGYCAVETAENFLPYLVEDYGNAYLYNLNFQTTNITGFLAQFPNNITCTTCVSEIANTFQHDLTNASSNIFFSFMQVDSAILQKCGPNFLANTSSLSSRFSWTAIAILFLIVAILF